MRVLYVVRMQGSLVRSHMEMEPSGAAAAKQEQSLVQASWVVP